MDERQKILVVEDEEAFLDAVTIGLNREGFEVEIARNGVEALQRFDEIDPDLVLLDLMLPRISGLDVCREIRSRSAVPIIIVTAKSAEVDTVVGLEVGADDYVSKPYRMRELVARIRAVLRRSVSNNDTEGQGEPEPKGDPLDKELVVGDVSINAARHEVLIRGESVSLPLKEFELLNYFLENAGRVLTRDMLIDRVWGHDYVGDTKTLDVHVKRLRSKIESDPGSPTCIVTIRGLGYKYNLPR